MTTDTDELVKRQVTVMEGRHTGEYVREPRTYTFDELRELFEPGDLVTELLNQCELQTDTIERLQREVEAMREGAEQLKFLCSRMFAVELSPDGQHKWIFRNKPLVGENVQAAIDAARSEGETP